MISILSSVDCFGPSIMSSFGTVEITLDVTSGFTTVGNSEWFVSIHELLLSSPMLQSPKYNIEGVTVTIDVHVRARIWIDLPRVRSYTRDWACCHAPCLRKHRNDTRNVCLVRRAALRSTVSAFSPYVPSKLLFEAGEYHIKMVRSTPGGKSIVSTRKFEALSSIETRWRFRGMFRSGEECGLLHKTKGHNQSKAQSMSSSTAASYLS